LFLPNYRKEEQDAPAIGQGYSTLARYDPSPILGKMCREWSLPAMPFRYAKSEHRFDDASKIRDGSYLPLHPSILLTPALLGRISFPHYNSITEKFSNIFLAGYINITFIKVLLQNLLTCTYILRIC
jgi:hypothetical protein